MAIKEIAHTPAKPKKSLWDIICNPWTISLSLAAIYLATLTSDYFYDGITFALQIEKVAENSRGPSLLFHQNHLLYAPAGFLAYRAVQALGVNLRALYLLQMINPILAAASVFVFFHLAEKVIRSRYAAAVCSAALGLSAVWWKLATDADAYISSVFLLLICANCLFGARPRWQLAGLAFSGAMLMHELAALFYPAALTAIYVNKKIERKATFAFAMSALAWGLTVLIYFICASIMHGISQPFDVIRWAASNQTGLSLSPNPLPGILSMPRANIEIILGHRFSLFFSQSGWPEHLLLAIIFVLICAFIFVLMRRVDFPRLKESLLRTSPDMREAWKPALAVILAWLIPYMIFLLFWMPWMLYYRIFYVPAIMLLFGLLLGNYHSWASKTGRSPSGAAALLVIIIALFNLAFYIAPNMRTNANPFVSAAREARGLWNDRTIIYFAKHNSADTAFEYFNDRTGWRRLTSALLPGLPDEIELIYKQGGTVWFNKGALELNGPDHLNRYILGQEIKLEVEYAPAHYVEVLPPGR